MRSPAVVPQSSQDQQRRASIHFCIANDRVGALEEVLQIVRHHQVNLSRIESRPSRTAEYDYEFFIDFDNDPAQSETIQNLLLALQKVDKSVKLVGGGGGNNNDDL